MYVEVNYKPVDDWVYQLAKAYCLAKMQKVVSWRAYHKMLSNHSSVTVPVVSRNPMNVGTGEKEERNIKQIRKRKMK